MSARKDKQISLRLPAAAGDTFAGRKEELKSIRDAFLEGDARAVVISGPPGAGKTALAVKFAQSLPEQVEYAYSFDCRGGILIEEVIYRLCQFLGFHGKGDFQNILLSPIPMELKLEFLSKVLKKLKILLIFDDMDSLLSPEHGKLVIGNKPLATALSTLINECDEGAMFLFTCTSPFQPVQPPTGKQVELPSESLPYSMGLTSWLLSQEEGPSGTDKLSPQELTTEVINLLPDDRIKALKQCAAYEKAAPYAGFAASEEEASALVQCGLLRTFEAGGETMYTIHSIAREYIRSNTEKDKWKALIHNAAKFRESYAREHGIIWHMLYAHALYVEAMDFEAASDICAFVSPTLLAWGQTDLTYDLNNTTAEATQGVSRASALYMLGSIEIGRSEYDSAMERLDEACSIFKSLDNMAAYANGLMQKGTILLNRHKLQDAIDTFEEALKLKEEASDTDGVALILSRLAQAYQDTGQEDKAADILKRSAQVASDTTNEQQEMVSLEKLGSLYASRGQVDEAIEAFSRELALLEKNKDPNALNRAHNRLGGLYFRKGDAASSLEHLNKSLRYCEITRNKELSAVNLLEISRIYLETKKYRDALKNAALSLALFDASQSESKSAALEVLGAIEKEMGPDAFRAANEEILEEMRSREEGDKR